MRLTCEAGRVSCVQVNSERPDVTRLLRGRTAAQAMQLVPSLFVLCGQAQAVAAALALAAARGEECQARLDPEVQREALREHVWRCLLDLPPMLGAAPLQQEFVRAVKCVAAGSRDELRALLTGPQITAMRLLLEQAGEPDTTAPHLLPPVYARESLRVWPRLSAEFCRRPSWRGVAVETGALARQMQGGEQSASRWSARWLARLDELLAWTMGAGYAGAVGTTSAAPVAPGIGRALVETARGLLMHEIALDGERVADYLIAAPTEWNFHPHGALASHLLGREAENRDVLQRQVVCAAAALDPCVPLELEWA